MKIKQRLKPHRLPELNSSHRRLKSFGYTSWLCKLNNELYAANNELRKDNIALRLQLKET